MFKKTKTDIEFIKDHLRKDIEYYRTLKNSKRCTKRKKNLT